MGGKFPGWAGWFFGAIAAVVVALAGWWLLRPEPVVMPPAEVAAPEAAPEAVAEPEAEAVPEVPAAPQTEAPELAEAVVPGFDVVRVNPDGSTLVAGRAEPGSAVRVLLDGARTAATEADGAGAFVSLFTLAPAEVQRVLSLESELADGRVIVSETSAIVEPFAAPPMAVAEAEVAEEPETAPGPAPAAPEAEPAPEPAPASDAPRVLLAGPDGIRVLQDDRPAAQLTVDSITYDDAGGVELAGRGAGDSALRIYLDNAPVRSATVDADGTWRSALPEVAAGVYTLRVDALGADGTVTGRVETPFKREEPEVLAAVAAEAETRAQPLSSVTIQPGNTLWAIAEGRYGTGYKYVQIYEANRDQIRDPDLIYPGQVFALPEDAAE